LQRAAQAHRQLGTGKNTVVNSRLQCRLNDLMGSHRRDTCHWSGNTLPWVSCLKQSQERMSGREAATSDEL
jgi:hypothetical protein